jgi:hypothetical protein
MGFINQRQYLELAHRDELRRARVFDIHDFNDKSDRTLTISRERLASDGKEAFRHIFIMDEKLHLHVYEVAASGDVTSLSWRVDDFIRAGEVEPTIRRGPSVTDYEFATIMENLHAPILFYVPESDYGHMKELQKNFFGLTKPSWERGEEIEF